MQTDRGAPKVKAVAWCLKLGWRTANMWSPKKSPPTHCGVASLPLQCMNLVTRGQLSACCWAKSFVQPGLGGKQRMPCPKRASGRVVLPSPPLTRCHGALARVRCWAGGHTRIVGEGLTLSCQRIYLSFLPRWPVFLPPFCSHLPSLRKVWGLFLIPFFFQIENDV